MESGSRVYDSTGTMFTLDHVFEGVAFLHPLQVVQTNFGDDFDEELVEADHLVTRTATSLSLTPPVAALEETIVGLKAEVNRLRAEKEEERKGLTQNMKDFQAHMDAWRKWQAANPMAQEIVNLTNGVPMWVLAMPSWEYHYQRPKVLDITGCKTLGLVHIGKGKFRWEGRWKSANYTSDVHEYAVQFFMTEEEMQKCVQSLWENVLAAYSNEKMESRTKFNDYVSGKIVNFKALCEWVADFPFLEIPQSVWLEKSNWEAAQKQDQLEKARQRLAELETTNG